jgi:PTS system nitrogen regulatory IIA component
MTPVNPVGEVLGVDDVHLDLDASTKAELLEQLAGLLAGRHGLSKAQVLESLTARERLGSTGLGHGVAIPHARMYECGMATGVFVRTKAPVPFDAPDGKPVSIFLALVVPKQATQRHLQLLATAAAMFSDRTFRNLLKASADPSAVRGLLMAWRDASASHAPDKPAE